jgi:hypothetical protein
LVEDKDDEHSCNRYGANNSGGTWRSAREGKLSAAKKAKAC